jgi:hypothetical protein
MMIWISMGQSVQAVGLRVYFDLAGYPARVCVCLAAMMVSGERMTTGKV